MVWLNSWCTTIRDGVVSSLTIYRIRFSSTIFDIVIVERHTLSVHVILGIS